VNVSDVGRLRADALTFSGARFVVNNPTRMISGTVALAGFVVAVVAGLAVDNPADVVLTRALLAMLACNLLGSAVGAVAYWTAAQHVERYKNATPIPSMTSNRAEEAMAEVGEKKMAA
jgi:phage shock protein PspC (stress-responsive transcriptional regulator)